MQAFHNDSKLKKKYLDRVKAHYKADEIIQGVYWENGKGCAVGCTLEYNNSGDDNIHERMERELGIPRTLAYIEDELFERKNNGDAKKWPLEFLEAIPVGADLSLVTAKFFIWQYEDKEYGLKYTSDQVKNIKECKEVCEAVVALYKRVLKGDIPTEKEWRTCYEKARAWVGAWAWAGAWAWVGAGAWAWAGAGVGAGAWAWAWAWAEYDKRIVVESNKLLELLKSAPVNN